MVLRDLIGDVFRTLWAHKLRTFLTMFGIAWGIVSIVLMVAAGEGLRQGQAEQSKNLGKDIMIVFHGRTSLQAGGARAGRVVHWDDSDVQAVHAEGPDCQYAIPELEQGDVRTHSNYNNAAFLVTGSYPEFGVIRSLNVGAGRFYSWDDEREGRRVAFLGTDAAKQLFPEGRNPLNEDVYLNGIPYLVIGVMAKKKQDSSYDGWDVNKVFIPFSAMRRDFPDRPPGTSHTFDQLLVTPKSVQQHEACKHQVRVALARVHDYDPTDKEACPIWDTVQEAKAFTQMTDGMKYFLGAVGVVTLFLGGIGVMNVIRSVTILVLGLALNAFPTFDMAHLRIPGILQRIAACYASAGLLYLGFWRGQPPRATFVRIAAASAIILIFYWALLAFVPVPGFGAGRMDSLGSLPAYVDRHAFSIPHLWPNGLTPGYGVTYDPEGTLSTLGATATVLIGVLSGLWLKLSTNSVKRVIVLASAGLCLLLGGFALNPVIPIVKKIWTGSFTLFSGGFAILVFAAAYWLCDVRGWKLWSYPLRVLGSNAILAFALSQLIGDYSDKPWPIRATGFAGLQAAIPNANGASFAFAVANLVLLLAILAPLYHRRIFLRV